MGACQPEVSAGAGYGNRPNPDASYWGKPPGRRRPMSVEKRLGCARSPVPSFVQVKGRTRPACKSALLSLRYGPCRYGTRTEPSVSRISAFAPDLPINSLPFSCSGIPRASRPDEPTQRYRTEAAKLGSRPDDLRELRNREQRAPDRAGEAARLRDARGLNQRWTCGRCRGSSTCPSPRCGSARSTTRSFARPPGSRRPRQGRARGMDDRSHS